MAGNMCTESLQADRQLLDPHFDGYKLSLDTLPTYSVNVISGIDEVKLRGDQYTLQHVKAFGIHNHLILDQWHNNCVYYVNQQWKVIQHRIILESQLEPGNEVFEVTDRSERCNKPRHNVTLNFPSPDLCVLSDGTGSLYLLATGNRDCAAVQPWKTLFREEVCGFYKPFVILHSMVQSSSAPCISVDCLLLCIEEESAEESQSTTPSHFTAFLDWVTITKPNESTSFGVSRKRRLRSQLAPFYAAIEQRGQALLIASESEYEVINDSDRTTTEETKAEDLSAKPDTAHPLFTWTQTSEDVIVTFILLPSTPKTDVQFLLTTETIHLAINSSRDLLLGSFYRQVDVQCSTWTLENGRLEVTLAKSEEGVMWPEVVEGNPDGQYVVDADQARIIHERLAHLTSQQLNPDPVPGSTQSGIGPHDLEECDALPEGYSTLVRLDGNTHQVTNRVSLSSHQFLFNAQTHPNKPPCICLRHDVDGLLWQPDLSTKEHTSPWYHTATYNALGYVQASKMDRKYSSCPANCSYAVICDSTRHVYVYRQPTPISTPLRNRKSGRVVGQIAKQQLISLESIDDILGIACADERVYVLTTTKLYIIRVTLT
ncbi:nudC domain-containing protein 1-like [Asterias amurensis]|uniref:nudC domain-containing protein 1-like n=1 Tax=Asterias amurensis TaxID=7602 RepID=UPI003AB854CE